MYEDQSHQLNAIGAKYYEDGKIEEASKYFEDAIFIYPRNAQAHNNLGLCRIRQKKYNQAVESFQKSLQIKPDYPYAMVNLASTYFVLMDYVNALSCYRGVDKDLEKYPQNLLNIAQIYLQYGKNAIAEKYYRRAIKVDPKNYDAINNLGVTLNRQGKFKESLATYKRGIKLYPDRPDIYFNMAISYSKIENHEMAVHWLKETLKRDAAHPLALAHLTNRLGYLCDWKFKSKLGLRLDKITDMQIAKGELSAEQPFMNIIRVDSPKRNLLLAKVYSQRVERELKSIKKSLSFTFSKKKKSKIRIGYISNGFKNFPTSQNLLRVLELHDRSKFEVYIYSFGENDKSIYRVRAEKLADKFVDISTLDYYSSAQVIYADQIDILIDLKGYTGDNKIQIMALKPAPIIVSLLGYVGSTGSTFTDYLIADKTVIPPTELKYYTEKVVYMPDTYWPTDDSIQIPDLFLERKNYFLPEKGFVFSAFLTAYKIEPIMFDVWMRILKKVKGSVLWMIVQNKTQVKNLKAEARKRNVDPDRLIFSRGENKPLHFARLKLANIALDTRIVNGHTTTTDALWAGVPVITLYGKHFASRVSTTMLKALELPELTTKNPREYEKLAIDLATNSRKLAAIKLKLAKNIKTKPLFKTERYAGNLEKVYLKIWKDYLNG